MAGRWWQRNWVVQVGRPTMVAVRQRRKSPQAAGQVAARASIRLSAASPPLPQREMRVLQRAKAGESTRQISPAVRALIMLPCVFNNED